MRVPFEWLKEFVDIKDSADEAAHKLTMIGLEVEAMEEADGDVVFEVNVTPNRADCLSIIGIARELSASYKKNLRFPEHNIIAETGELDFNIDILDTELCHRYAGRIVKNLKITASPDWLISRLKKCNIRPINNVVDITNYVLLELGHPLHAFDLKTIKGHQILVGTPKKVRSLKPKVWSREKTKIVTLDGMEREIPDDSLLIWDSERPIAIAGIMGGIDTEVSDSTVDIFIESAYFDPISVRRTSKALGIKTESSYRFERGTDIKMLKKALDRAAYLMKEVADGEIYGKLDIYPKRYFPVEITVRDKRINEALGLRLSREEILSCLSGLGLKIEETADSLKIEPPAYRGDLQRESDIIEEIARLYGYDMIPAELPKATIMSQESRVRSRESEIKSNIKQSLLKSGFTEAINYSFMGLHELDLLQIKADDERRKLIQIKNPLRAEDSFMRTTIMPALIKNLQHNVSHGSREMRLFEMGKVFISQNTGHRGQKTDFLQPLAFSLPIERDHLAAIYYKEKIKTLYKDETPDFYIVKGVIEAIFNDLKIYDYSFVRSSEPFLHPGQSADIYIDSSQKSEVRSQSKDSEIQNPKSGIKIGYIGMLSPEIIDSLDIKAHMPSVIMFEINIGNLMPYSMQAVKYRPIPKYPFIERDTAIIVDALVESADLMKLLKSYTSDLIEDIYIFDVYKGKNIPEGKKSIAFNVRYRALDRTLKDDEIDALHNSLVNYILEKTNGQLRG